MFVYYISKYCLSIVFAVYFRLSRKGTENIPTSGAFLLASNHSSHLDPPILAVACNRHLYFLARSTLFKVPLLSLYLKSIGVISIKREGIDRKAFQKCIQTLQGGSSVVVFPEGTRTTDGGLQQAKPGLGMIIKSVPDCPVLPVYIDGTYSSFPKGAIFPKPTKVTVYFGKPFTIDKYDTNGKNINSRFLSKKIMEEIEKIKEKI